MSVPPQATIYFVDVPSNDIQKLLSVGIDFNFFQMDNSLTNFRGIKLISPGIHFFHYETLSLGIRNGMFMNFLENHVYFLRWDQGTEEFQVWVVDHNLKVVHDSNTNRKRKIEEINEVDEVSLNISKWIGEVPRNYQFMINFGALSQQENYLNKDWHILTSKITMNLVNLILPNHGSDYVSTAISTFDCSKQENEKLLHSLRESLVRKYMDQNKDVSLVDQEPIIQALISERYKELKFTSIDFKRTQRPNATLEQITRDSLDKSWYLHDLLTHHISEEFFIGEFQLCFVGIMLLNNYNCAEQWMNMIKILMMSFEIICSRTLFYICFMKILNTMLSNLNKQLVEDQEGEAIVKLYDLKFLKTLKEFQSFLFYDLTTTLEIKQLQKLTLELFEKFRVKFDMLISLDDDNEEEEDDEEYNPVIVTI